MSNDYINGLLANDKARYIRKLQCLHGTVGDTFDETMDRYCFSDRHWIDDIRQWPAVDFQPYNQARRTRSEVGAANYWILVWAWPPCKARASKCSFEAHARPVLMKYMF